MNTSTPAPPIFVLALQGHSETYIPSIDLVINSGKVIRPLRKKEFFTDAIAKIWKLRKEYSRECWEDKKKYNETEFFSLLSNSGIQVREMHIPLIQAKQLLFLFNRREGDDPTLNCMFEMDEDRFRTRIFNGVMNQFIQELKFTSI